MHVEPRSNGYMIFAGAVKYLEGLGQAAEAQAGINVHFITKPKGEDGQAQAQELLSALRSDSSTAVIGTLLKARAHFSISRVTLFVPAAAFCMAMLSPVLIAHPGRAACASCRVERFPLPASDMGP